MVLPESAAAHNFSVSLHQIPAYAVTLTNDTEIGILNFRSSQFQYLNVSSQGACFGIILPGSGMYFELFQNQRIGLIFREFITYPQASYETPHVTQHMWHIQLQPKFPAHVCVVECNILAYSLQ
jgi:hypothetical protein